MFKDLSASEKIRNAAACLEVENLHARHVYCHSQNHNMVECDTMWSHDPRVSWGHSFGKWLTFTGVKYGWAGSQERQSLANFLKLTQVWPQVGGEDYMSCQEYPMHTLATDIIEIADDGKTARASFYTPGTISSTLNTSKEREGMWMWERYGIEYICEDGEWKLFTTQVCADVVGPFDVGNPSRDSYEMLKSGRERPGGLPGGGAQIDGGGGPVGPHPDEIYDVAKDYTLVQPVQNPVPWPEPYETYNYNRSYRYPPEEWK
jgi:hypothetical protein